MGRGTARRTSPVKMVAILVAVIGGVVGFLAWFYSFAVPDTGGTALSGHGTTALILGVVFSMVVGVGLMILVFVSSRRGYDDAVAGRENKEPPEAD